MFPDGLMFKVHNLGNNIEILVNFELEVTDGFRTFYWNWK